MNLQGSLETGSHRPIRESGKAGVTSKTMKWSWSRCLLWMPSNIIHRQPLTVPVTNRQFSRNRGTEKVSFFVCGSKTAAKNAMGLVSIDSS